MDGTQPLTLIEDPRIVRDGVTLADLREQFDHNIKVRDLVSDVNRTRGARLRRPRSPAVQARSRRHLASLKGSRRADLITPAIRYSKPELQTHITYLYTDDQLDRSEDGPRR